MPEIIISSADTCRQCIRRSCSIGDVVERKTFSTFKTERNRCPLNLLSNGPDDLMLDFGRIDGESRSDRKCIYCYICVDSCSHGNLAIRGREFWTERDFASLKSADASVSNSLANAIASSYLNSLFDFAANTTLNRSVSFDGIVYDSNHQAYFVEVDLGDDSLECFRRLLGDMAMHNANGSNQSIETGIIVLSNLPKAGSRDVYTLAKKVRSFPGTSNVKIYVTTFQLLRHFMLSSFASEEPVDTLLFEIVNEEPTDYINRLVRNGLVDSQYANALFGNNP